MDILILALLSGIAQLAAHYIPWKLILRRKLRRTEAYTIGVALMMVPFSVWAGPDGFCGGCCWPLWVVIVTNGALVIGAYVLDHYLLTASLAQAADAENKLMRESDFNDQNDR